MGERTLSDRCSAPAALGFLTVVDHQQLGLVGGYLILNAAGRPKEFHCTAPIKPNRAQQILFGPTLVPYFWGEQIAQTLLNQASLAPSVVWTDEAAVLCVREHVSIPVALSLPTEEHREVIPDPARHFDLLHVFSIGPQRAAVPQPFLADRDVCLETMAGLENFDLSEPFGRIREAIEEAQRQVTVARPQAA